ncbi:MAG: 3,4-dehydroadipyl-CoA semialdehyde dehydrogenase [Planctomycetota bacterium]|jgi:3,4-dehydroadipyl-CoA semialdehyde dehydrogenase
MLELKSFLQNEWQRGSGDGSALYNPSSGEAIASASTKGLDLGAALAFARKEGGPALRAMTFAERGALLTKMSKAIHAQRAELLELSTLNTGTTLKDSKFDIDGATGTLAAYGELGAELGDKTFLLDGEGMQVGRSPRFHGQHIKVPLRGVGIHINAFNFPAWGFAEKLACSFLAGVPVLTKPATSTAMPSYRIAEIVVESGLCPPGSWSFLCGSVGDLLDHATSQDIVAFTGSANTARLIRGHERIIQQSVRVNAEADSLNAMVVGGDVEVGSDTWDLFIRELTREITQKSGQKCTATRRVFLPEALIEPAIDALRESLLEFPAGDPMDEAFRMGPLSTPAQFPDVQGCLRQLAEVSEIVIGSIPDGDGKHGALMEPVVFHCRDPKGTTLVHELEAFGPVCTLMPYSGEALEAGEMVALGGGSLVATSYSDDIDFTRTLIFELAPWNGRVLLGSKRVADFSTGPGVVMPQLVHGGPGRAGGGLELGGLRGLSLYMQTCAVQGSRPMIEKILGA